MKRTSKYVEDVEKWESDSAKKLAAIIKYFDSDTSFDVGPSFFYKTFVRPLLELVHRDDNLKLITATTAFNRQLFLSPKVREEILRRLDNFCRAFGDGVPRFSMGRRIPPIRAFSCPNLIAVVKALVPLDNDTFTREISDENEAMECICFLRWLDAETCGHLAASRTLSLYDNKLNGRLTPWIERSLGSPNVLENIGALFGIGKQLDGADKFAVFYSHFGDYALESYTQKNKLLPLMETIRSDAKESAPLATTHLLARRFLETGPFVPVALGNLLAVMEYKFSWNRAVWKKLLDNKTFLENMTTDEMDPYLVAVLESGGALLETQQSGINFNLVGANFLATYDGMFRDKEKNDMAAAAYGIFTDKVRLVDRAPDGDAVFCFPVNTGAMTMQNKGNQTKTFHWVLFVMMRVARTFSFAVLDSLEDPAVRVISDDVLVVLTDIAHILNYPADATIEWHNVQHFAAAIGQNGATCGMLTALFARDIFTMSRGKNDNGKSFTDVFNKYLKAGQTNYVKMTFYDNVGKRLLALLRENFVAYEAFFPEGSNTQLPAAMDMYDCIVTTALGSQDLSIGDLFEIFACVCRGNDFLVDKEKRDLLAFLAELNAVKRVDFGLDFFHANEWPFFVSYAPLMAPFFMRFFPNDVRVDVMKTIGVSEDVLRGALQKSMLIELGNAIDYKTRKEDELKMAGSCAGVLMCDAVDAEIADDMLTQFDYDKSLAVFLIRSRSADLLKTWIRFTDAAKLVTSLIRTIGAWLATNTIIDYTPPPSINLTAVNKRYTIKKDKGYRLLSLAFLGEHWTNQKGFSHNVSSVFKSYINNSDGLNTLLDLYDQLEAYVNDQTATPKNDDAFTDELGDLCAKMEQYNIRFRLLGTRTIRLTSASWSKRQTPSSAVPPPPPRPATIPIAPVPAAVVAPSLTVTPISGPAPASAPVDPAALPGPVPIIAPGKPPAPPPTPDVPTIADVLKSASQSARDIYELLARGHYLLPDTDRELSGFPVVGTTIKIGAGDSPRLVGACLRLWAKEILNVKTITENTVFKRYAGACRQLMTDFDEEIKGALWMSKLTSWAGVFELIAAANDDSELVTLFMELCAAPLPKDTIMKKPMNLDKSSLVQWITLINKIRESSQRDMPALKKLLGPAFQVLFNEPVVPFVPSRNRTPALPSPDPDSMIIAPLNALYADLMRQRPAPDDRVPPSHVWKEAVVQLSPIMREWRDVTIHSPAVREAAHLAEVERRVAAEWTHLHRDYLRAEREECGMQRPRKLPSGVNR